MTPDLLENLRANTAKIRDRWEALLRVERVNGPLANPDALVHLIPQTLGSVLSSLIRKPRAKASFEAAMSERLPICDCGCNPYLAYFTAGEQALVETVVLLQAEQPTNGHSETDVAQVICAIRSLARSEIDTFCGVCTHHGVSGCRFVSTVA